MALDGAEAPVYTLDVALTAASTLDNALDQLNAALGYEESGLAMARDYRESVRWLVANRPSSQADASSSYGFGDLREMLRQVETWIAARDLTRRQPFAIGRMPR